MAANNTYNTVTVTTSATLIAAANPNRKSLIIQNTSAGTVYFGPDTSITTANSNQLRQNDTFSEDSGGTGVYKGNVYGIVGSGTSDVRYWERSIQP